MKSCLVVDDSKVIRMAARRILEQFDFDIREAENGQLAMDACLEEMPDVVLLDWNMPVMDGLEFLVQLRRSSGGDKPRVLFCTTENDLSHIKRALDAGADEYIMKPFNQEIIASKLAQVGVAV